jgi:hypothetical protein
MRLTLYKTIYMENLNRETEDNKDGRFCPLLSKKIRTEKIPALGIFRFCSMNFT